MKKARAARKIKLAPVVRINDYRAELVQSIEGPEYQGITAFALVTVRADGTTTSQYSQGTAGAARLLGAVELLRSRICREVENA